MVSLWGFTLVFASLSIMVVYNCLNTYLYILWNTLILISCIASHSSLSLCLMSSLPKEESLCTKLIERRNTIMSIYGGEIVHRVGWEKKHDNVCLSGRACIEMVRGVCFRGSLILSFFFALSLVLPLFVPLDGFAASPSRLPSSPFLCLLGLLAMLHVSWIWNLNFLLCIVNVLIKGEIEKPSG
jgi:hypothetical protein